MRQKSNARIYAFQFLYHLQCDGLIEGQEIPFNATPDKRKAYLEEYLSYFNTAIEDEEAPSEKCLRLALELIDGVLAQHAVLEKMVEKYTGKWSIDKINKIDLTILLLATYELNFYKETPAKVVIDEAIKLAKSFSEKSSYSFINGVLDSMSKASQASLKEANGNHSESSSDTNS
ncbi:MAG: transcription antitermination factor NusB [Oligoflexia bacterium]|nr:transcription antitermination factor NusB [Oligoflexia bacterium]MBF0366735.1 transcription antitermination factor NusB [Oligoflexia bacterium]